MPRERNRTVKKFQHNGDWYRIHERTNYTSNEQPFTRRFVINSNGAWIGDARTVKEARVVLEKRYQERVEEVRLARQILEMKIAQIPAPIPLSPISDANGDVMLGHIETTIGLAQTSSATEFVDPYFAFNGCPPWDVDEDSKPLLKVQVAVERNFDLS